MGVDFWDERATEAGVFNVGPDYDRMTRLQAQYIVDKLDIITSQSRILDLGCGIGRLIEPVRKRVMTKTGQDGWGTPVKMVGVDSSMSMLLAAADAVEMIAELWMPEYWRKQDLSYNGAYCVLMFQHVNDDTVSAYLTDIARLLRPGARLVTQWTVEGESAPMAYPRTPQLIEALHVGAGLTIVETCDDSGVTGYADGWLWTVAEPTL